MSNFSEHFVGGENDEGITRRQLLITGVHTGSCLALALAGLPVIAVAGTGPAHEKRFPLPTSDSATIDRQSQVIIVRYQNFVYAFALSCPHENAAVKWLPKDNRFQCSKHDSQYRPDGLHTSGRATRNMDRYAIVQDGTSVVVDLQHWFQSDKDPAGWNSAAIRL
jgi:nitrite reductase/ring-hydroxylating ferredoxin subunit